MLPQDTKAETPYRQVMIVDDDPISNLITEKQLYRSGLTRKIQSFTDACEALSAMQKEHLRPDLLLLDLYMPGLDGWEFLERLASIGLPPRCIYILSAWIYGEEYARGMQHPLVKGMLLKPLNRLSLRELLP